MRKLFAALFSLFVLLTPSSAGILPLLGVGVASHGATPPPVSNIIAWFDASVTGSITLNTTTVTNWADQTSFHNDLGDGTTTAKPTYSATAFNTTFPGLVLSPGHSLRSTTPNVFNMGVGNTLTFWYVGTLTNSSQANGRAISYWDNIGSDFSTAGSWIFFRVGSAATAGMMRATIQATQSITYGNNYRFIGTISSLGVMTLYVNGVASTTATSAGVWVSNGTLGIGASLSDTVGVDGVLAEVGISTDFTDATGAAALDTFLKAKWGL